MYYKKKKKIDTDRTHTVLKGVIPLTKKTKKKRSGTHLYMFLHQTHNSKWLTMAITSCPNYCRTCCSGASTAAIKKSMETKELENTFCFSLRGDAPTTELYPSGKLK